MGAPKRRAVMPQTSSAPDAQSSRRAAPGSAKGAAGAPGRRATVAKNETEWPSQAAEDVAASSSQGEAAAPPPLQPPSPPPTRTGPSALRLGLAGPARRQGPKT